METVSDEEQAMVKHRLGYAWTRAARSYARSPKDFSDCNGACSRVNYARKKERLRRNKPSPYKEALKQPAIPSRPLARASSRRKLKLAHRHSDTLHTGRQARPHTDLPARGSNENGPFAFGLPRPPPSTLPGSGTRG